jgi:hypothetical protein
MAGDVVTHPMSPISADRTSAAQNIINTPTSAKNSKSQKVERAPYSIVYTDTI